MSGNISIDVDRDFVILAFPGRGDSLVMSPDIAEKIAEHGLNAVNACRLWVDSGGPLRIVSGEVIECSRPVSWDGKVNVKFNKIADMIPIPYKIARILFEEIRARVPEARMQLTIVNNTKFLN